MDLEQPETQQVQVYKFNLFWREDIQSFFLFFLRKERNAFNLFWREIFLHALEALKSGAGHLTVQDRLPAGHLGKRYR